MPDYQGLKKRLDDKDVVILDGAIATELQDMGAPMHPICWCAEALITHPYTVIQMHERYINAGVDIITTNTFSTLRHVLEASGYGHMVREMNARSVYLAREAIERASNGRPIWVAGAMGNFGVGRDPQTGALHGSSSFGRLLSEQLAIEHYEEMAGILAESGVDFFMLENLGNQEHRKLATKAAKATGLPVWVGFGVVTTEDGASMLRRRRPAGFGRFGGPEEGRPPLTLADGINEIIALEPDVMTILHSTVEDSTAALAVLRELWDGPVAAYPDSRRADFQSTWLDRSVPNDVLQEEFVKTAGDWVESGTQVIGGCCGYGVEYIKPLRGALPSKITA